jgi:aspartyl-tRNA synthetase
MLMIGGIDKYFQIAKCFRDEDLRTDRQPEFTQIDAEMSFITSKDIMHVFEKCINQIFKKIKNIRITKPWKILTYDQALKYYGTDKPDIRFNMKIINLTKKIKDNKYLTSHCKNTILAIKIPDNQYIKNVEKVIKIIKNNKTTRQINISNIICIKNSQEIQVNYNKLISKKDINYLIKITKAKKQEIIIILYGNLDTIRKQISQLRLVIGNEIQIINKNKLSPLWVIDFPLMKWDTKEKKYKSVHHPFTSPKCVNITNQNLEQIQSDSYDMVINGHEIGGGSIRIHKKSLQKQIFEYLGLSKNQYESKFGFFINALSFGVPPHGGIAIGLDRLIQILYNNELESNNIKEFIPFPKDNNGQDNMIHCPDKIEKNILKELNIKICKKKN